MLTQDAQFEQNKNVVVVTIAAVYLGGDNVQELTEEMSQRMRCDNAQHFILDLAHVQFMDSAAIGSLVMFLQDLEHVRGRVALAGCQPNVAFLFKVTRLDAVFGLYDDVEAACEALHCG